MSAVDLLAAFERLERPRVLVVGDLILDRYTWGDAERVSQEAPVILLRADRREARLGGAGNVCAMLRGLEAEVICVSVVGADSEATVVRNLLADCDVDLRGVLTDPARPTTVKERFIGRAQGLHPHQILRVDSEVRDAVSHELEQRLVDFIDDCLDEVDIVLVSDYDKGVCTPHLVRQTIDRARLAEVPVLVDPIRSQDYSKYRGATTMTPNRTEAGLASGVKIVTPEDAFLAGHKLCRQLKLDLCIVTLDRDGMAIVYPDGRGEQFSTQPKNVYDITGAGDMVLAMIGVALAGGLSPEDAVRLGNVAGGLEVEKVGVAVIERGEIRARLLEQRRSGESKFVSLDTLRALVAAHRSAGESIVFTNGCFDLLHVGHLACLQEAAKQGDVLIVALNSDASIRRLKGPTRPVIQEHDRAAILSALDCVDYVVTFDADTPAELLRQLQPDVLVKGGTYQANEVVGHDIVAAYGGRVHLAGVVDGISTSAIVAKTRRGAA
ncbi:MAG: D-glycero-beta-D-manno-heptose 1-phosphate adenylyltransferase [Planctomycetaceae bacterium]|nr:D-glycero-beta-D-manno-heptose 1-phosphate adenylyltransferase [Planctomycetaceae bacterium]